MQEKREIRKLIRQNRAIILYLLFGGCTTVANIAVYWLAAYPLGFPTMAATVIAWIAAVLLAYITNRKWVFHSEARTLGEIARETGSFFACRIGTGCVDWLCMFVFVDCLRLNDLAIKFFSNVIVVVLNYAASKLLIFRKRQESE